MKSLRTRGSASRSVPLPVHTAVDTARAEAHAGLPPAALQGPSLGDPPAPAAGLMCEIEAPLGVAAMAALLQAERLRELGEQLGGLDHPRLRALLADLDEGGALLGRSLARASRLLRQETGRGPGAAAVAPVSGAGLPLAEVLQGALRLPLARFSDKIVACALDVEPDLAAPGNPVAWSQVLSHLVANSALHGFAGRHDGQIRITARRSGADVLRLTYHDNGVGLSPAAREHAFRRRFTSRAAEGSGGLGLCILRDIVQGQLNGAVALIETEVGAAFAIDVPAHPAHPAA